MISDYLEKPKRKKKHDDDREPVLRAKTVRNFKIIDDDINLNNLRQNDDDDGIADLLDPDARPSIADDVQQEDLCRKLVKKVDLFTGNKWVKIDLCQDEDGDFFIDNKNVEQMSGKGMFKKRGEKKKVVTQDDDDDLDTISRRPKVKVDDDGDASPVRVKREKSEDGDLSPVRIKMKVDEEIFDETKVKVRHKKVTKEDEMKKAKEAEIKEKYAEWGKGLAQKRERDEKLKFDVYEADKPLARYKDDKDLENLLKKQERDDDPMLEYLRSKNSGDLVNEGLVVNKPKVKYRGPPPPPNRYNILPGSRWDGVDRSNGFEKKYYESIMAKKALEEEAFKWSTEDM